MNLYFEFDEQHVGIRYSMGGATIPARYCFRNCDTDLSGGPIIPYRLIANATRVWQEDETGVKFIKNRNSIPETTPVDSEELMWVKLSAVTV